MVSYERGGKETNVSWAPILCQSLAHVFCRLINIIIFKIFAVMSRPCREVEAQSSHLPNITQMASCNILGMQWLCWNLTLPFALCFVIQNISPCSFPSTSHDSPGNLPRVLFQNQDYTLVFTLPSLKNHSAGWNVDHHESSLKFIISECVVRS